MRSLNSTFRNGRSWQTHGSGWHCDIIQSDQWMTCSLPYGCLNPLPSGILGWSGLGVIPPRWVWHADRESSEGVSQAMVRMRTSATAATTAIVSPGPLTGGSRGDGGGVGGRGWEGPGQDPGRVEGPRDPQGERCGEGGGIGAAFRGIRFVGGCSGIMCGRVRHVGRNGRGGRGPRARGRRGACCGTLTFHFEPRSYHCALCGDATALVFWFSSSAGGIATGLEAGKHHGRGGGSADRRRRSALRRRGGGGGGRSGSRTAWDGRARSSGGRRPGASGGAAPGSPS